MCLQLSQSPPPDVANRSGRAWIQNLSRRAGPPSHYATGPYNVASGPGLEKIAIFKTFYVIFRQVYITVDKNISRYHLHTHLIEFQVINDLLRAKKS